MKADEERLLIAAALHGNDRAFSALVDANQQAVRAFLRRFTGYWAGADDISQEAFVVAWTELDRFRGETRFRSWVCGIGYRIARSAKRSFGRTMRRDTEWAALERRTHPDVLDEYWELDRAMRSLPDDQRAAIALCLGGGFTHVEAAEILKIPLGTVKAHVSRGRERLLKAITSERPS